MKNPIHHHNQTSPVIFRELRREDEKDTREKRKNVNEPAGSSSFSFYPSRVGALREKDPLDFWYRLPVRDELLRIPPSNICGFCFLKFPFQ
jgi:hypothetical protein